MTPKTISAPGIRRRLGGLDVLDVRLCGKQSLLARAHLGTERFQVQPGLLNLREEFIRPLLPRRGD